MYQVIPSPAQGSVIIRDAASEIFRPASFFRAGDSLEESLAKIQMEQLESVAAASLDLSPIACAAHFARVSAEQNATNELVERLSVAAWWTYRRGGMSQHPTMTNHITHNLPLEPEFNVSLGEIPSVTRNRRVWVSAIETRSYPYAVIGTASHEDPEAAAQHAYHESLLSYGASVWIRSTRPTIAPRWDFGEIHARTTIDNPNGTVNTAENEEELLSRIKAKHTLISLGETSVSLITSPLFRGFSTNNLAQLVKCPDEQPKVFTEANL